MNAPDAIPHTDSAHVVHLYGSDTKQLTASVGEYLAGGAERGEGLLVVATAQREADLREELARLSVPVWAAERSGAVRFIDAHDALASFMVDGYPNEDLFLASVGSTLREVQAAAGGRRLRAYGEMVGILWERRQFPSAIRLEQLWNGLQTPCSFDLYCAYPIDIFDRQFSIGVVGGLLCTHSTMIGADRNAELDRALGRAIDEVVKKDGLRVPRGAGGRERAGLPHAENTILWVRSNLPDQAEEIVRRAQAYYLAG
jgi:hypothetical protein